MAGFYKICAVSIILLLVAQDAFGFKENKELRKSKELKQKGKQGKEESFLAEGKSRHSKYSQEQNHHQRPVRSLKESKMRVVEDAGEERLQFSHVKGKKAAKLRSNMFAESEESKNSAWGKKAECASSEKRKQKCQRSKMEEGEGNLRERRGAEKKAQSNGEESEAEEELFPEDLGYRVQRSKRFRRERKIPAVLIFEEARTENGEVEPRYTAKVLRRAAPRLIIDSADDVEVENVTGHQYLLEEALEEPSNEWNLDETEEEYEEDFL